MGIKTMADAGNENERAASHLSRSRREKVSLGKPQMRGKRGQRKLVAPSFFFFSFSFFAYRDLHVRSQVIGGRVEADRNLFALASDDGLEMVCSRSKSVLEGDWTGLIWGKRGGFRGARASRTVFLITSCWLSAKKHEPSFLENY